MNVAFCDFRVPLVIHFGDQGQHKKQNTSVFVGYFSGVGSGRVLGCFLDACSMVFVAFWYFVGSFLEAFGSGAAGIAG